MKKAKVRKKSAQLALFVDPTDDRSLAEFERAIEIDQDALDECLQDHSVLFYKVAKSLALLVSRRDALKQDLAETEAKVDIELREVAAKSEVRVTEKELESLRRTDKTVLAKSKALADMNLQVQLLAALKEAVLQRGHALRELVTLYVNEYNSTIGGQDTRQLREARAKEAQRLMRDRTKVRDDD